jgi:hypothetical protein
MLADQFLEAIAGARAASGLDDLARKLWSANGESQIDDAAAAAISEAIKGRRAAISGLPSHTGGEGKKAASDRPRAVKRREKMFGVGRPRALDRNAKVRILHLARCLSRRTEPGKAYGAVTAKALAVLEALLWAFHNARSGLCFPSYERIAEAAGCARSTVAESIKALEDAGILSWVQRIKRVRERCSDLLGADGWRWRVLRTSNAYSFNDPSPAERPDFRPNSSKSEKPTGTPDQDSFPLSVLQKGSPMGSLGRFRGSAPGSETARSGAFQAVRA